MKIAALVLTLFLTLTVFAQTPQNPGQPQPFIRIERIGEPTGLSFFVFSTTDRKYTIRYDGLVESEFATVRRPFQLKVNRGRIDRLYIAEFQGDLLLAYELRNSPERAYLARVEPKTRAFRWISPIAAVNLGPVLIDGNYVFATGQNLLTKLDLQTGRYVWQTPVEKQDAPFAEFQLPEVDQDRVVFRESGQRERWIEVDKASGKILKTGS